jgi:hypothetical protein
MLSTCHAIRDTTELLIVAAAISPRTPFEQVASFVQYQAENLVPQHASGDGLLA